MRRRAPVNRYVYNPACGCEVCERGGVMPSRVGREADSFCYGKPHVPPSRSPWR